MKQQGLNQYIGTNAERLALVLTNADIGSGFYETDTKIRYFWKGTIADWVKSGQLRYEALAVSGQIEISLTKDVSGNEDVFINSALLNSTRYETKTGLGNENIIIMGTNAVPVPLSLNDEIIVKY